MTSAAVTAESSGRAASKSRQEAKNAKEAKSGRAPKAGKGEGGRGSRGPSQPQPPRFRSLDSTGNVRVLSDRDLADLAEDDLDRRVLAARAQAAAASEAAQVEPAPDLSAAYKPAGAASEWPYDLAAGKLRVEPGTEPSRAARELPIAGYDGLSLPSLRARLRNLDVAQLRQLVLYEISHAYRSDVVTMFERRIAKLQGEGDD